jgi:DNA-binding response OmpR family regulator
MNPPRLLIVDDEPNIRFILERILGHEGYIIETAIHGADALKKLAEAPYDLLLLDLQMEPVGGLKVLQAVRTQDRDMVVIILTAHSSVESAVEALRLGAFDYLFKPATPEAIRQRVREGLHHRRQTLRHHALLRQIERLRDVLNNLEGDDELLLPPAAPNQRFVRAGKLVIDRQRRLATLNDNLLDLTTAEFDLLLCLAQAAPRPMSARELVNCALGYDSDEIEARDLIKWHIYHLRRKIEPDPANPHYIKNVRHKGYLWSTE